MVCPPFIYSLASLIDFAHRAGTVESRIRQLVMKLEYVDSLTLAHPFIKGFDQISYCLDDAEVRACASGDVSETVGKRKKEEIEGKEGASTVYTTTFYIGLAIEPKQRKLCKNCFPFYQILSIAFGHRSGFHWASKT